MDSDVCTAPRAYYIKKLSHSWPKIQGERAGLEGVILTGSGLSLVRDISSERLYGLILPLKKQQAERKQSLYCQIEEGLVELNSVVKNGSNDIKEDIHQDRQLEHWGIGGAKLSTKYLTHCLLSSEFQKMCEEYDQILPAREGPFDTPLVIIFHFPGITRLDPCLVAKPFHEWQKKLLPTNPGDQIFIKYRRGDILDALPPNAYMNTSSISPMEWHNTPGRE